MIIENPILKGFNPDPSICRVGEDYYIATSTFEWFPGVQIHHSKDLKNWHLIKHPLNRLTQVNMRGNSDSGGVWAPALSYHDDKFWLIYSDVKVVEGDVFKDVNNYLITSETIDGDWSDPIYLNSSGFDPSLFHDDDGKKYLVNMVWDYRSYKHRFYGISLQEYNHIEKRLVGEPKIIFKGTDWGLTEAPHLYKIDGFYYLLTAEGGTTYSHAATIARSKTLHGEFEVHPHNPLISSWTHPKLELQKAGHASIVHTHTDEWYLVHLTGRPINMASNRASENRGYCPLGRETAIQKLYWQDGWPYVEGGNFPSLKVKGPKMEEVTWERDYLIHDSFDSEELNINFNTLRVPFTNEIGTLTERKGYLRLFGGGSPHNLFQQSLVARRWQTLNFRAETYLEFKPKSFQQFAGLINYYGIKNWTSFHLTNNEERGLILEILSCDQFKTKNILGAKAIKVPEKNKGVYLAVEVKNEIYYYSYSFDGKKWIKIDIEFESYKLSDDYVETGGFFTGAFIGVHAVDLTGSRAPADFDYFKYDEK
ncbi:glycoside hydrolase family 43 protein [Tuanshanicoccus lijuaniae]|uniref:glycoside hydrolase family 43 protein n=1 Tax=Aerococcaceae bacterium zg-1292 TaxID=2774330 RepID=UPI001BD89E87|nr:glycoside hydrolase family 43 protein [Aerococcaceae bacterium zg-A91]MBS4457142.1 glycoside hydrolase family 43 protein [Aerococcaceae bacterium zg-BR33]